MSPPQSSTMMHPGFRICSEHRALPQHLKVPSRSRSQRKMPWVPRNQLCRRSHAWEASPTRQHPFYYLLKRFQPMDTVETSTSPGLTKSFPSTWLDTSPSLAFDSPRIGSSRWNFTPVACPLHDLRIVADIANLMRMAVISTSPRQVEL